MKIKLLFLLLLCFGLNAYAWKPIMVGHRGCNIGVENSVESYTSGVDVYGFNGLECDVRVTSDGKYVISHDETTNRLGGELTVANATLEQLQAETYTQTHNGVTYTGKICTVAEYLDICKNKDVFPLIELKYTTGINSNSMSNFPGLMKLVTDRGLEDKAIFFTSMQYSLEYIRTNYPNAKCQYLISTPTDARFDWCVKWNVNPTYEAGVFNQALLVKLHRAGLSAAVWTVDNKDNYIKYGNMGVYMITSNGLKVSDLPELEEMDWDSFPPDLSPIDITVKEVWSRSASSVDGIPTNFPSAANEIYKTGQQAAIYDGTFYVNDYGTATLFTFDKDSKECSMIPETVNQLSGTHTHGITNDDAGNIIQRNETIISATPSDLLIYKKGSNEGKALTFSLVNPGQTNFITASGDIFSEEGGHVYLYPNKQNEVYILNISNGTLDSTTQISDLSAIGTTAGYVIPINNDPSHFIYQVRSTGFYLYNGKNKGDFLTGRSTTSAPGRNSSIGGAYLTIDDHVIFVYPSGTNYNGGFSIKDMSATSTPTLATINPIGSGGYNVNISCGTFMKTEKINDNLYYLYTYTMGNGYAKYEIAKNESGVSNISADENIRHSAIYPNPAEDMATIFNPQNIKDIRIYTLSGSLVAQFVGNNSNYQDLNISTLKSGTYLVRINNLNTVKLIKL